MLWLKITSLKSAWTEHIVEIAHAVVGRSASYQGALDLIFRHFVNTLLLQPNCFMYTTHVCKIINSLAFIWLYVQLFSCLNNCTFNWNENFQIKIIIIYINKLSMNNHKFIPNNCTFNTNFILGTQNNETYVETLLFCKFLKLNLQGAST